MSLVPSSLTTQIVNGIRAEIRSISKDAINQPFQDILAHACAYGFVVSLKNEAKAFGGVGVDAIAPGKGISGLSPDRMTATAKQYMVSRIGYEGIAINSILLGIYKATVTHLALTDVTSTSGKGGQSLKVVNLQEERVKQNILDNFPENIKAQIAAHSKVQFIMIEAISHGFCVELLQYGIPGFIPMAGVIPGNIVATFS
jgi:hypothetical protein